MLKFADCNMAVGQPNAISGWRIYDSAQIACQAQRCGIQKGLAFCNAALDLHPLDGNAEMCLICRREPFYLPVWMVMPNHTGEFWNVDELERRMRLADVRAVRLNTMCLAILCAIGAAANCWICWSVPARWH